MGCILLKFDATILDSLNPSITGGLLDKMLGSYQALVDMVKNHVHLTARFWHL